MTSESTKKPVHRIRLYGVEATISPNPPSCPSPFGITLRRVYKDNENRWKSSEELRPQDLLIARTVVEMAFDYLWARLQEVQPFPTGEKPRF